MDVKQEFDFSDPQVVFEFGVGSKHDNVGMEMFLNEYNDASFAMGVDDSQMANTLLLIRIQGGASKGAPPVDPSYEGIHQEAKPYVEEADPLSAFDILDGHLIPYPYHIFDPEVYLDDACLVIVFDPAASVKFKDQYGRVVTGYSQTEGYDPCIAFIAINELSKAEHDELAHRLS